MTPMERNYDYSLLDEFFFRSADGAVHAVPPVEEFNVGDRILNLGTGKIYTVLETDFGIATVAVAA